MADLKQCILEVEDGLQVLQETPVPQTSTPPSPAHLIFHSPNGRGLLHPNPNSNPDPDPHPNPHPNQPSP